jgi:hypothetical protein
VCAYTGAPPTFKKHRIRNLDGLEPAAKQHKIKEIKHLGTKTEEGMLSSRKLN